jgi:ElaB/YqjD/DUF883 family membrane-anchored ribosome-binding protein
MAIDRSQEGSQREGVSNVTAGGQRPLQSMAEGIGSAAERIREKAPQEGRAGRVAERVAQTLENGSRYLSEHDVPEIADDVTQLVKRYPMQTMWVGLGVGFLLGRIITLRRQYS